MEKEILLKPCPFCGFSADITGHLEYDGYQGEPVTWRIRCKACSASMTGFNKDMLKEMWNTRCE